MGCNENNNKSQPQKANSKANSKRTAKRTQSELKANSKQQRKMSANTTFATLIKEIMAKMPDDLENKKEIDLYYKKARKEVNEKMKEDKKEAKAAPTKRAKGVKKVEVDSDGNEIIKEKKPLTKYLQFIQDNRQKVKDENPNLSSKEYMVLLANLWNKHKEDIKTDDDKEEKKDTDNEDSDVEDKKDDEEEEEKKGKKGKKDKKGKTE